MEEKEKIVLKDGTVYDIENGASENLVQIPIQSVYEFPEIYNKFTESNLESYQIQNAEGLTCATRKNKYLANAVVEERKLDVLVTFNLADVDMVQKQLDKLIYDLGIIKEGQKIQDGAIYDLSNEVGNLVEGSEQQW